MTIRTRIVNVAVAVTTLASCFALGELGLRFKDLLSGGPPIVPPPSPYRVVTPAGSRLLPGADVVFLFDGTERPVRVRVDSHGFRGPELTSRLASASERILILGDSVTFGYGVEEDSTFAGRLDSMLRNESCLGASGVVMNGGVEDVGIREERMILQEIGHTVEPTVVLIGFYANDSRPPVGFRQEYLAEDPVDRWVRTHPSVTFRSRLISFLHHRYRRLLMGLELYQSPILARFAWVELWQKNGWKTDPCVLDSLIKMAQFDWGAAWLEESWGPVADELETVREWCGLRGVALGVFYLPVAVQVAGSRELPYPARKLGAVCERLGIPFYDTVPVLNDCEACFMDQCHLTPQGHRRVAKGIVEWLCREFITPKPPDPVNLDPINH